MYLINNFKNSSRCCNHKGFVWIRASKDIDLDVEIIENPAAADASDVPMVDLTAEDPPQIEGANAVTLTAAILHDVISSLEDPALPAPKIENDNPPPVT